jgi:hypothetical protein
MRTIAISLLAALALGTSPAFAQIPTGPGQQPGTLSPAPSITMPPPLPVAPPSVPSAVVPLPSPTFGVPPGVAGAFGHENGL